MTDSQQLLAEYRQNGSDAAFRELVTRYVDLVYSTALRLVEGDTHRAEDVAQTVFVDLARKAQTLPHEVRLGGWLHRDACLVAGHTMRGERRRQSRERQAVEMNVLQNHSDAGFSQVAPLLDEAIDELGEADRTAILLRFFEQQDFRAVGQALGSNEDAARMRVTRALDKLHTLLTRRGATLSAAALGTALATEAVTAAPAVLAAQVVSKALANAGAPSLIALTTGARIGVIAAVVLVVSTLGLLVKPKLSPVRTAPVAGTADGDANPATEAAPRATFRRASQSSTGVPTLSAQPAESLPDSLTTESFLLNPPAIAKAVFENEDLGLPRISEQSKQRYLVRCDNTNYFIAFLPGPGDASPRVANGKFNGSPWSYIGKRLIFKDPAINSFTSSEQKAGLPTFTEESAHLYTVNLIANLGFPALSKTNRVMDNSRHQLSASFHDGRPAILRLMYDKDIVTSATLRDARTGRDTALVNYRYDTSFYGGRFPSEFTRSFILQGGTIEELCVVRVFELELTNQPLPESEMNPRDIFSGEKATTLFFSNNVSYEVTQGGARKIRTAAELQGKRQLDHP